MPPKKKSKQNISGLHNQKATPVESGLHDDVESEDEENFLDKIEEERLGVNPRKYRNKGLHVALMWMAINIGDDLMDEDWIPKETRKKLHKERKSIHFSNFLNKMILFF